ncbi:MAG: DMT family transporter [Gammaproteobacteria bacterium]|nr:DMT family transporter [Gammaproteobacteria bacterium]
MHHSPADSVHAVLWMTGALLSFCLLAVGARELSGGISVMQMLLFRSVIGVVIIGLVIVSGRRWALFASARPRLHGFRHLFHFAAQYCWFVGLGVLPLAEVFALEFTVPLWTMLIAVLFLGEQVTRRKLLAIGLCLAGVVLIVRPGSGVMNMASAIVIVAAILFAISHSATKALSSSEHPLTILFYMCLVQLPLGLVLSIHGWKQPESGHWLWIVVIGITALTAHYCMTRAMHHAEITTVVTLDFFRLPLIILVGVVFYHESFDGWLLAGAALMLFGNRINLGGSNVVPVSPDPQHEPVELRR